MLVAMADDLAFLFNDPGPKPARVRPTEPPGPADRAAPREARHLSADIDWMTLRQAHDQTSIPISTLRKWARKGKVRARLTRVDGRELRFVAFEDIVERARALDRSLAPVETIVDLRDPIPAVQVVEQPTMAGSVHIEPVATVESVSKAPPLVHKPEPATEEPASPAAAPEPESSTVEPEPDSQGVVPEGSILVPIDAWDNLLGQLGNLHEAGQQLADARERAAKAETEAEFLKERLRDLRKRAERAELALEVHSEAQFLPEAAPRSEPVLQIGWRRFRDRWLGK